MEAKGTDGAGASPGVVDSIESLRIALDAAHRARDTALQHAARADEERVAAQRAAVAAERDRDAALAGATAAMAERDRGVLAAQQEADAARTTMANVARVHDGTHAEANELVERAFSDLRHAGRRFNRVEEELRRRRWHTRGLVAAAACAVVLGLVVWYLLYKHGEDLVTARAEAREWRRLAQGAELAREQAAVLTDAAVAEIAELQALLNASSEATGKGGPAPPADIHFTSLVQSLVVKRQAALTTCQQRVAPPPVFNISRPRLVGRVVCRPGLGAAVSTILGRLVVSNYDDGSLSVFALGPNNTFLPLGTLGGVGTGPLHFDFSSGYGYSGLMAFTAHPTAPTLLVTDHGNDRVVEVDVLSLSYMASLFVGEAYGARGVATSPSFIAVSCWDSWGVGMSYNTAVHLFNATSRAKMRVLGRGWGAGRGQFVRPYGLRISRDERRVAVTATISGRVILLDTDTGAHVGLVAGFYAGWPYDVEEYEDGWMVLRQGIPYVAPDTLEVFPEPLSQTPNTSLRLGGMMSRPYAVMRVPGVGLVVRDYYQGVLVFGSAEG